MPACPNCGRQTARTEDWACQWCGYPLRSEAFPVIHRTYSQLQADRLAGREPPKQMDARAERETRRLEEIARLQAEKAARQHSKKQAEEARRQNQAGEREARLAAMDAARRASEEAERARLMDEAWEEAVRMSREQAERERREAGERATAAPKAAEPAPEAQDEAWEEAMRMSREQAEKELKEADERAAEASAMAAQKEAAVPATEISVDELSAAFNADSTAAHQKYANSTLRLTGKVARVVANEINNNYAVTLSCSKTGEGLRDVRCKFGTEHAAKLKQLEKGEEATIIGEYAGVVVDINLRDCRLL